jgi:hypothetical protein
MAAKIDTQISITEITILTGKKRGIKLDFGEKSVSIPVDEAIFAHYKNQLWRENPTPRQKKVFATVMSLMRAAYMKGCEDGKAGV